MQQLIVLARGLTDETKKSGGLVFGAGVNGVRSLEALYYQSRVVLPTKDCTSMLGEGLRKKDFHH